VKLAVVLFNLGGPDSLDAVEPFLRNLFSDPAIISLPAILRLPLAWFIAKRRTPFAKDIYAKIGGRSPILEETQAQARALESVLAAQGHEARAFIAMRCWKPFSDEAALAVKAWAPERIVLLPLYPQYSSTTTASSIEDWTRAARASGITSRQSIVQSYPAEPGFISALADNVRETWAKAKPGLRYRLLLSAHGLPERVIARGDPYQGQVEQTAAALVRELGIDGLDHVVCYQSRVGPLKWLEPSTDAEIARAGAEGLGVIVAPIAFVSEHSETLVELDIEYGKLAREAGVPDYRRAATVSADPAFIDGLAGLVRKAVTGGATVNDGDGRICPAVFGRCGYREG
jgi:protoporphyrin/coproporphyrin ferrochelatase